MKADQKLLRAPGLENSKAGYGNKLYERIYEVKGKIMNHASFVFLKKKEKKAKL